MIVILRYYCWLEDCALLLLLGGGRHTMSAGAPSAAAKQGYAPLAPEDEPPPLAEDEQAPVLGVDRGASPAEAEVRADAAAETGGQQQPQQPRPPSCCKRCSYRLLNRRVRGLRLPAFLGLLGSLVLPEMDAVSDWLVTLEFYEGGDMGWFEASLTVLLVSGGLATLALAWMFANAGAECCQNLDGKGTCGSKLLLVLL
eukprot:COSAG02_NODE_343_length_24147_cov_30.662051_23_plen_198_part_01